MSIVLACWSLFYGSTFALAKAETPERIISLGPAYTESLYLLGVEDRLVGCTSYCQRPPAAKEKEKIGTALTIDLEKAVSLEPDLVIATSVTSRQTLDKLEALSIETVRFPAAKSFDGICRQLKELGELVGREDKAEEIVAHAEKRVGAVQEKVGNRKSPKVAIQVGARPLVVAGIESFANDFIELAGGRNVVDESGYIRYSREKIVKDNPDVIIVVTMGVDGEDVKRNWRRFKSLNATRENRIFIMDAPKITTPTPLVFAETLEEIAKLLDYE